VREGKIKLSSDWNKDLKIKFTIQDPCNLVRKTFGDSVAGDMRYVLKACVGEENFVDTWPNKSNNFCCGGGGGFLQSGFKSARQDYGKIKHDQIMETGAKYVITPCHNCHSQVHDLSIHYEGGYECVHLWTVMALSMGILGPDERVYLDANLSECGINECTLPPDE